MNIHIAMLGRVTEPIKTASNRFGRIDKLILIVGKEFEQNAEDLKTEFEKIWGIDVTYYTIDPFTKNGVMEIIEIMKKIKNDYPKDNMYINISGGTNLMAGVALSGAFMIGCKEVYYLLDPKFLKKGENDLITIPVPKIIFPDALTPIQRAVLMAIYSELGMGKNNGNEDTKIKNIKEFADRFYKKKKKNPLQTIKSHIDTLKEMNLIEISRDEDNAKQNVIKPTEAGRMMMRFIQ
jgi:DNA-binding MarR family transcriptional regulator